MNEGEEVLVPKKDRICTVYHILFHFPVFFSIRYILLMSSSTQSPQGFDPRPRCLLPSHVLLSPLRLPERSKKCSAKFVSTNHIKLHEEWALGHWGNYNEYISLSAHPTGKAILHLHCLHYSTLLAITDLHKHFQSHKTFVSVVSNYFNAL